MGNYRILRLSYYKKEPEEFAINRPHGLGHYMFFYFLTPVKILCSEISYEQPGACVIYAPGQPQYFTSSSGALIHAWISFVPGSMPSFDRLDFPLNKVFRPLNTEFIVPDLKAVEMEYINREHLWEDRISALMEAFLIKLHRNTLYVSNPEITTYKLKLMNSFKQLRFQLYSNANEEWNVPLMARTLSLSKSYFCALYQEFFGISPKQDLITARISQAKHLLTDSVTTVEQVAQSSGYTNVYHFIRQFKAVTGVTPGNYMKKGPRRV